MIFNTGFRNKQHFQDKPLEDPNNKHIPFNFWDRID